MRRRRYREGQLLVLLKGEGVIVGRVEIGDVFVSIKMVNPDKGVRRAVDGGFGR